MIPLSAAVLARIMHGRLDGLDGSTRLAGPVVADSRHSGPGALFVCVVGERTDGHDHVPDAMARGAIAALAAHPVGAPAILVDDPVQALGLLAADVLRRTPARVVGVTGSSGKTSTKDLIADLLATAGPLVAATGSMNTEVGLPLTALRVDASTAHLVLEYGARGIGHIAYLCGIARPDVAAVLNVGSAHLGEFGSREIVARSKGELVEALPAGGTAVLVVDDPLVAPMATRTSARVLSVGSGSGADIRISDVRLDAMARPEFMLATPAGSVQLRLRLSGRHQAINSAVAAGVALSCGVGLDTVAETLERAVPRSAHRMHLASRDDGLLVVDDAYNANPESMGSALESLIRLGSERQGRTWAVLGEMRELGPDTDELHVALGRRAAEVGVAELVVVGAAAAAIATGWEQVAPGRPSRVVDSPVEAGRVVAGEALADDTVLVKASNSLELWRVAEELLAADAGARTGAGSSQ
ncbi:MAG TPA: UDP-N-acetylmuramoyl-tripeptide--D-alanyl-D-alanine ligase [Mycobacteriales bacterium]|jgi:UDP-N-acetylmuramoyl-tripeptide--D-alanyl-D-alanine ligase|nr:UDP-N-acetylmuramoyl-tripeptide--D-alanyl-D-alanine ligase [Mycobacteriales bacterium]